MALDRDKLQAWAMISEVVSGVAIVATLIFLAFEMRDNTNASQAQTNQILMRELNGYRKMLAEPAIAEAVVKRAAVGWDKLDPVEKRQIRSSNLVIWGIYESAYFANERGILGPSEWSRFESRLCALYDDSQFQWSSDNQTTISELHTREFVEYVEDLCR